MTTVTVQLVSSQRAVDLRMSVTCESSCRMAQTTQWSSAILVHAECGRHQCVWPSILPYKIVYLRAESCWLRCPVSCILTSSEADFSLFFRKMMHWEVIPSQSKRPVTFIEKYERPGLDSGCLNFFLLYKHPNSLFPVSLLFLDRVCMSYKTSSFVSLPVCQTASSILIKLSRSVNNNLFFFLIFLSLAVLWLIWGLS